MVSYLDSRDWNPGSRGLGTGTGTSAQALTRRWPMARRIFKNGGHFTYFMTCQSLTCRLRCITGRLRCITERLRCITGILRCITGRLRCDIGRLYHGKIALYHPGGYPPWGDAHPPLLAPPRGDGPPPKEGGMGTPQGRAWALKYLG